MKVLIVIDMQNDFIDGSLGTKEALAIVDKVADKIKMAHDAGQMVIFTRDTHHQNYLETQEVKISVDAGCCACVSPESHKTALASMKLCQINVTGKE